MKLKDVKTGMKVVANKYYGFRCIQVGDIGEIKKLKDDEMVGVRFDRFNKGKPADCGFIDYIPVNIIEPYIEKKKTNKQNIQLIFNGTTTIAIAKNETGKYTKGVAKLHHEDIYDKLEGIRIAVGRALGLDVELPKEKTIEDFSNEELLKEIEKRIKPKYSNFNNKLLKIGKVKCKDKHSDNLTFGKEYIVIGRHIAKSQIKPCNSYEVYTIVDDTGNQSNEPSCLFDIVYYCI